MMSLATNYKENISNKFSVTYDSEFDILRLSNYRYSSFSYEELDARTLLMIDDDSQKLIGLEVYGLSESKDIFELLIQNGYEFMANAYSIISSKVQEKFDK